MCKHNTCHHVNHLVLATTSQLELFVRLQICLKLVVSGFWTVTGTMQLQILSKIWTKYQKFTIGPSPVGTAAKQRPIYSLHGSENAEIDMNLRHMWFW